ncbi:amidohydrolase [Kineobactrum salinum]|uniref:Amidohydrolase n=1 Tax=Kineobactrum salinum TaxID=2708301 RepID=A0A6C0TXI5_9GAMM|nr:amidohydrolase [Kineobactrum salinum]QIB64542.1 amidohydrolase [Kineobactrum salinum]
MAALHPGTLHTPQWTVPGFFLEGEVMILVGERLVRTSCAMSRYLRRYARISRICAVMAMGFCSYVVAGSDSPLVADRVLHHGKVVTVNESFDIAEAIAIRNDKILAVGSNTAMEKLIGPETVVFDLQGKTVIPGLIDGHYHFLSNAVAFTYGVDVALVPSIAEMVNRIGEKVKRAAPGEVIYTTSGWLPQQFVENRTPTREDLDPVSPNNPVVVLGGHSVYLNSYALREAGIDRNTPSPDGGTIVKAPDTGEPTGRLIENAAYLARQKWAIGQVSHQEKVEAVLQSQEALNAAGITGVREPGVSAADMRVYQELADGGDLTVRISMSYSLDTRKTSEELISQLETWGISTQFGDEFLRLDGIGEFGIDGGFEAGLMSEHYVNVPGNEVPENYFGLQRIPTEKFNAVMVAMGRLGWRSTAHVVGDRGLDIALDAYEQADDLHSIAPKRWVLEHGHHTRPDQFDRMRDLGMVVSAQFHPYMAAQNMEYFWGKERAKKSVRVRDWLDAGLLVGGGSDWTLLPADPFWMMYFWVTRDTRLGGIMGPEQRISREEALQLMTINNAYITFEEDLKGSLEPGKLADLVVLSADLLTVPEEEIKEIKPLLTLLGGKVVFREESL